MIKLNPELSGQKLKVLNVTLSLAEVGNPVEGCHPEPA
jgi:hypothetical protein